MPPIASKSRRPIATSIERYRSRGATETIFLVGYPDTPAAALRRVIGRGAHPSVRKADAIRRFLANEYESRTEALSEFSRRGHIAMTQGNAIECPRCGAYSSMAPVPGSSAVIMAPPAWCHSLQATATGGGQ